MGKWFFPSTGFRRAGLAAVSALLALAGAGLVAGFLHSAYARIRESEFFPWRYAMIMAALVALAALWTAAMLLFVKWVGKRLPTEKRDR